MDNTDFTWEDIYYEEVHPEWDDEGNLLEDKSSDN